MATLAELNEVLGDSDLQSKIKIAILISAEKVVAEVNTTPNHAERMAWAFLAMANPGRYISTLMNKLLAENESVPVATIIGASDATIQGNADGAVNFLAGVVA